MAAVPRKSKRKPPAVAYRAGKPYAVLLDINAYRRMLKRLEDWDDLRYIDDLRKRPMKWRTFDEFLAERGRH